MAVNYTPRTNWIDEGVQALAAGGPDAVRIEVLARSLGVTKGGFYWHFVDRRALLDEILDTWERLAVDEVIEQAEAEGGDPRTKLRKLAEIALAGEKTQKVDLLQIDISVRDWARRDKKVARRLKRVDNRRMDYIRSLFTALDSNKESAEVRSLLAFALWIGSPSIAADHDGRSRREVTALAFALLIEQDLGD